MEDVLALYHEPYDPVRPVVCFDETNKEFVEQYPEPYSVFFEPQPINHRIANQSALFAGWFLADSRQPMDECIEDHPEFFRRVVIPAKRKQSFRD